MYVQRSPIAARPPQWVGHRRVVMLPGVVYPRGRPQPHYRHGMGALTGGAATAAGIASTGAAITGSLIALAIPVAGPIVAGIILAGNLIANAFSGCGQTCTEASKLADQVQPILQQNLDTYLSAPVRYRSLQLAALNNFDTAWAALSQACSNPALQAAGKRCISDRQKDACHYHSSGAGWKQTNGVWAYDPGTFGSGSDCWNWFTGFRDPIANDPAVQPDPVGSSVLSAVGIDPSLQLAGHPLSEWLLPAALIVGGLTLL